MKYNSNLLSNARNLRTNATKQENHLWYDFLRDYKPRFTRQRIAGNYILDFYCAKAKLAVELDGSQHYEENKIAYDKNRTTWLESLGIKVMRFTNIDVDRNFEGVCFAIDDMVRGLVDTTPGPSGHPLLKKGAESVTSGFDDLVKSDPAQ